MPARLLLSAALLACLAACATPPAPQNPARALHERLFVMDTHLDTPALLLRPDWNVLDRHSDEMDFSQVDLPRMIEGGLDGGFWVIYTPQGPRTAAGNSAAREHALWTATRIREMVAANPDKFELAFTAADAARIHAAGKRVVYQSIENSYPLGTDLSLMKTFYTLGVRMISPVHFANNALGDSATSPTGAEWGGLSPLGRDFVAEANRLGMILDASHASDAVFDQMLALSKTPIILSHSGCKAIYDHPRNIDDERLKKLAAAGGVIQMNTLYLKELKPNPERRAALQALDRRTGPRRAFTAAQIRAYAAERAAIEAQYPEEEANFEDFMAHMLHALKLVGPDHVGLGADWDGGGGVEGLRDVADYPKITERLLAEGYTEEDLAKIWGGNVLRVLRAVEAAKAPG